MPDTSYTYLLILLGALAYPALRYVNPHIPFPRWIVPQSVSIAVTSLVFIVWDIGFTHAGVWAFNPDYVMGIRILGLPLEEVLFFFVILYCCLFIYEVGKHYFRLAYSPVWWWILLVQLVLAVVAALLYAERIYSVVNFIVLGLVLVLILLTRQVHAELPYFYVALGLSLMPFVVVNGLLTSMPVVQYDDAENLGVRLLTIPLDDFFYCQSMLFLSYYIYVLLKK